MLDKYSLFFIHEKHNLKYNLTTTSNFDLLVRYYEYLTSFFHPLPDLILIFCFVLRALDFIHSLPPRFHFDLLLRYYKYLISLIYLLLDCILIFCFVITNTWFHSFICSKIEFWSFGSLLRALDFIRLSAHSLNFDLLLRYYKHSISFINFPLDWILIFCFIITNTWFHSFTTSKIEFWYSASLLRTLDFKLSSTLRLNFDLLLRYYEHLISFIHLLPDWILIFYFVITNTWFHSLTCF